MKYTETILKHPEFLRIMKQVKRLEKDRRYCHHELEHALDVARMAWIAYLEERISRQEGIAYLEERISRQEGVAYSGDMKPEQDWTACLEDRKFRQKCQGLDETVGKHMNHMDDLPDKNYGLEQVKDLIYVCALLHDIGRAAQYETGVHHSISGLSLAGQIMDECDVPLIWKQEILNVISEHHQSLSNKDQQQSPAKKTGKTENECSQRQYQNIETGSLGYYIRKADHDCRLCFFCEAKDTCKWEKGERNKSVIS